MGADAFLFFALLGGIVACRWLVIVLPRGDRRRIDTGVVVAGFVLSGRTSIVLTASVIGGLIGFSADRLLRGDRYGRAAGREWTITTVLSVAGILVLHSLRLGMPDVLARGDALLYLALGQGVTYASICEAGWLLARWALSKGNDVPRIAEPVWLTHLVHITLVSAGLRAGDVLGSAAVVFSLVLVLMLQYGLVLYVRMRSAYAQTILGVSRAIQLALGEGALDWTSLANLCVAVGKCLRCDSKTLETLNSAALLCGLGLVGVRSYPASGASAQEEVDRTAFLARSAAVVAKIPRLELAAAVMDPSRSAAGSEEGIRLASAILRCCVAYQHALKRTSDRKASLEEASKCVDDSEWGQRVLNAVERSIQS